MTELNPAKPAMPDRLKSAVRERLRAADRLRLEYVEAWYTPIGQRALQMTAGLGLLNVIVLFAQLLF